MRHKAAENKRQAGILLPVFSLPSPYGIGTFGHAAYKWVDFLYASAQRYWQVLPLGPTGYGDSPYQSFSAFAGNPYFIDLELLCEEGLLTPEECSEIDWGGENYINYQKIYYGREIVLKKAFARFTDWDELASFRQENAHWLEDYALFTAIKADNSGCSWTQWPEGLRLRKKSALNATAKRLTEAVNYNVFVQYEFYRQWNPLKQYANSRGIAIIGDIPIYTAMDSADTWANSEIFLLDKQNMPIDVAGCPPDAFSADGQLWGNPLYRWDVLKKQDYKWWLDRLSSSLSMFDYVRIDHFRGFEGYYAIPYGSVNAKKGEWRKGPGMDFIGTINKKLSCKSRIIAEDLGFLDDNVRKMLRDSGYPGMKVLQFAFNADEESSYMPHNYDGHCIVYTGTHDNDTTCGWYEGINAADKAFVREYFGIPSADDGAAALIRAALSSVAAYAVIPMQDYLSLGSEARINTPSTLGNNWKWRLYTNAATNNLADRIAALVKLYGRLPANWKKESVVKMRYRERVEEYLNSSREKSPVDIYNAVSLAAMEQIDWKSRSCDKTACYFSAEFLIGRMICSNLLNLGLLDETKEIFDKYGIDINIFEDIEDAALGNGGLGRLAACFLDSAASMSLPLNGYGIRYKYGLFKQSFRNGFQNEVGDDWTRYGDPWSVRREKERVRVDFGDQSVWAVPYDMLVIGYGGKCVNTLRLWQSEPIDGFNLPPFNRQDYSAAFDEQVKAGAISSVLYPNDDTNEGKVLRLKQQYFFSSASLQSILCDYKAAYGSDFKNLAKHYAIQLNDTHPVVAIPELLRILIADEEMSFDDAFEVAEKTFAYTNHTIMAEALEKWDTKLFCQVLPEVYPYVVMIQNRLMKELADKGITGKERDKYRIVDKGHRVHMARLAIYAGHSVNGVAALHTDILKNDALNEWYKLYPERFNNKTNGITQRRWLALCNPKLSAFITERIGAGWITKLDELKKLEAYADDDKALKEFMAIKHQNKCALAEHIRKHEGVELNPNSIFDVQIKRLHEYKRQLLNAFSILDIYFMLKEGKLPDFYPTTFIFGAKAAPSYERAKGVIKFINEIAKLVNNDPDVKDKLTVVFVQNYNVSYAEKLVPAADVSEQISTAGTEASGTGNMKLMLNGAVTLGTMDGANVEIVEQAGINNNYIFGATVDEIKAAADSYNPQKIYKDSPSIKRVLDTLIDGTFSDGNTGIFRELCDALLKGAEWHKPDHYYLLLDLEDYIAAKLRVNKAYKDRTAFTRQCLMNTVNAGVFSSDRTIKQYAGEIWGI